MKKPKLSAEERGLLQAAERGEFVSVLTDEGRAELQSVAANTFREDKRINIRLSNRDWLAVQSIATQEGISYLILVSSIIHKYVSGSLRDVTEGGD
ncbi:MAG: hypothetical protein AAF583_03190 [Pseudomonadota bacterium]